VPAVPRSHVAGDVAACLWLGRCARRTPVAHDRFACGRRCVPLRRAATSRPQRHVALSMPVAGCRRCRAMAAVFRWRWSERVWSRSTTVSTVQGARAPVPCPYSTRGVPVEYPVALQRTRRVPVGCAPPAVRRPAWCAPSGGPPRLATRMHAIRLLGLGTTSDGCRNTALHVAAASKGAHTRAAMVAFLIAERADVGKANKKGCAAQRGSEQGGVADGFVTPCRSPLPES
jgi:hypothetical protein